MSHQRPFHNPYPPPPPRPIRLHWFLKQLLPIVHAANLHQNINNGQADLQFNAQHHAAHQPTANDLRVKICYLLVDSTLLFVGPQPPSFQQFVDSLFYVGKGNPNRPIDHFIAARHSFAGEPRDRIRTIWLSPFGHIVTVIVSEHLKDHESLDHEASIYYAMGGRRGGLLVNDVGGISVITYVNHKDNGPSGQHSYEAMGVHLLLSAYRKFLTAMGQRAVCVRLVTEWMAQTGE